MTATDTIACPFCYPDAKTEPLHKEMEAAKIAAIVQPAGKVLTFKEALRNRRFGEQEMTFRVINVLKGQEKLTKQTRITTKTLGLFSADKTYLLAATNADITRSRLREVSPAAISFLEDATRLSSLSKDDEYQARRLVFFLPYLNDGDKAVSASAFYEFSKASYKTVKAIGQFVMADDVLGWIQNPAMDPNNYGFLFLLVGLSGDQHHASQLKTWLASPTWQKKKSLDGLISAYLLLTGSNGVDDITRILENTPSETRNAFAYGFYRAVRFHADNETVLSEKQLARAYRNVLDYPAVSYLAVDALKGLRDWQSMARVMEAYTKYGQDDRYLQRNITAYLKACPQPQAKAYLAQLSAPQSP
jgi:hypothetical protein